MERPEIEAKSSSKWDHNLDLPLILARKLSISLSYCSGYIRRCWTWSDSCDKDGLLHLDHSLSDEVPQHLFLFFSDTWQKAQCILNGVMSNGIDKNLLNRANIVSIRIDK